jgi:hypothetical protein
VAAPSGGPSARDRLHARASLAAVRWTARLGAVTAGALADSDAVSVAAARGRLLAAERLGLLCRTRPLRGQPSLFVATREGLRVAGLDGSARAGVSPAGAGHALACARVAIVLARAFPRHVISGEDELRFDERSCRAPLASAELDEELRRERLHRPDLVLWPPQEGARPPVAVEVELSVKAPVRLREICLAWARCRCVAGVLYVAAPEPLRALRRALGQGEGTGRISLVSLETMLARESGEPKSPIAGRA